MKALAVDLGGSHASIALVEEQRILAKEELALDAAEGLVNVLPLFADAFRRLTNLCGTRISDCAGIAISSCGLIDSKAGKFLSTNGKWDDALTLDLPAWGRETFGLELRIENDARMALLGEWYAGAAQNFTEVVMVTLGTGIGGAAMIGGKLLRGKHSQAGNLGGHIPVLFTGRKCMCGAYGCAEAEAGGWSMPLVARESSGFASSALAREPELNFEALFRNAAAGDQVACEVRDRCIRVWAATAVGLVHSFDPEVVVFGGGVMRSADVILPCIQSYVAEHAWTPWGKVKVAAARLGNDAGLLGAIPLLTNQN
ncbi:MAG TPA: ROK family protein [Terriglobales bacterium]|nr:ROK family protein [Terriglobales bacterium]